MNEEATTETATGDEIQAVQELHKRFEEVRKELSHVIVGMDEVIEQLIIALLCRGHCILEGVPGLAKTLLISQVASMLGLSFSRIQFTPDLMPGDITGTDVLEEDHTTGKRVFRFLKGPLFANIILADEINRTPPKTQSALLEAMQERQLTVGGETYPLPHPFFVLATQNPIEQEGTYPLPEAQLDRFMLKIQVDYPSEEEETEIVKRVTTEYTHEVGEIISGAEIERMQSLIRRAPVADHVYRFAIRLVRASRPLLSGKDGYIGEMVNFGAGPRASIYLLLAAKARAVLRGKYHVTTEDISAVALPTLRHRILPTFKAEAAGQTTDDIIRKLLAMTRNESSGRAEVDSKRAVDRGVQKVGHTVSRLLSRK